MNCAQNVALSLQTPCSFAKTLRNEVSRWQNDEMNQSDTAHLQPHRANSICAQLDQKGITLGQSLAKKGGTSKETTTKVSITAPLNRLRPWLGRNRRKGLELNESRESLATM